MKPTETMQIVDYAKKHGAELVRCLQREWLCKEQPEVRNGTWQSIY